MNMKKRLEKKLEEYDAAIASLMKGDRTEKEVEEVLGQYSQECFRAGRGRNVR